MDIASNIPTEILGEIFFHAIDGPVSNIQDNGFPWALNKVCKSWRFAFVTCPCLWTWITIDLDIYGQDLNTINQGLSLFLERSRDYPLNISLCLPTEEYDENSPSFTRVWETFLSCSHRWQTMYLSNVLESQLVTLDPCTGATPILQSLAIHRDHRLEAIGHSNLTAFQIAPHLTRFILCDSAAMFAVGTWSVPWMQLTDLLLLFNEIVGVDQLYVLFKQLRDIEELSLIGGDDANIDLGDFVYNSRTPQCLAHLRVLIVSCVEIFDLITAPSLSELYLQNSKLFYPPTTDGEPHDALAQDILSSFIQRSSCKIRKLTLSDFLYLRFTSLIGCFPNVVELCLTDDAMMCMEHLLSPEDFPELRVLDCTAYSHPAQYFLETLPKILQLRNSSSAICSAAPLAKVIFRLMLEDGEAALVTTSNWASFKDHVHVGSWCAHSIYDRLGLTIVVTAVSLMCPDNFFCQKRDYRVNHDPPNTNIAPSPSSSTLDAPLNPDPILSQTTLLLGFMQHLSDSLDDFDFSFRNDGGIDFEILDRGFLKTTFTCI